MANETLHDSDASLAADLERSVLEETRPAVVCLPLVKIRDVIGEKTLAKKFPKAPTIAAASVAEGTDLTNTASDPTSVTITAAEVGLMVTPTDLANKHSVWDIAQVTAAIKRACVEKWDTDIAALYASFSNTVGATGVDLSLANFLSAIFTLEDNDVAGPYASGLHTVQIADLRTALIGAAGAIFGNANAGAVASLINNSGNNGAKGELFDVQVFASTVIPTANAAADRAGGMFGVGENSPIGFLWADPLMIELQRDASLRATEVVGVSVYGTAEIDDVRGVAIITDA